MNMRKISAVIVFIIIFATGVYYFLSEYNLVPNVMTLQETLILLSILISILIFLIIGLLIKIMGGLGIERLQNLTFSENQQVEYSFPPSSEHDKGNIPRFFIGFQNYMREATDLPELLDRLLVSAAKVTHSERGSILLYDEKHDELYIYRTLGWEKSKLSIAKDTRMHPGEGIAGRVFLKGKPLVINDFSKEEEFEPKKNYKTHAFVSIPVFSHDKVIGVLNLTEKSGNEYTRSEIDVLRFICNEVAILFPLLQFTTKGNL